MVSFSTPFLFPVEFPGRNIFCMYDKDWERSRHRAIGGFFSYLITSQASTQLGGIPLVYPGVSGREILRRRGDARAARDVGPGPLI